MNMDFVLRPLRGRYEPNADVFVDDEHGKVVVCVELAGAQTDSLHISLDERHLIICGRRSEGVRFLRGSFAQKEIAYGEFVKRVTLPVAVEYTEAVATYADGMLVIGLPVAHTAYLPTARTEIRLIVKRTLA